MKKYKLAILCMASATAISAQNAITSTGVEGFLARGIQMYDNENYNGCIDQMSEARALDISKSFAETADYYIALSKYNRGDSECLSLLEKFLSDYPASTLRQSVLYTIGNYHFYKDRFDEALTRYEQVPETAFDGQRASELTYRKSFCYIRQKDYDKARRGFNKLKGKVVNTLLFPNLSSANSAYKLIQAMSDAEMIGPIQMGLNKPVHFTDIESSVRDIVNITVVAVIDAIVAKKIETKE